MLFKMFVFQLFFGSVAFADQPTLRQITDGFFKFADMHVSDVEINELEIPSIMTNSKEIFFRHAGVYYNCTLDVPRVSYNRVGKAYDVRGFNLRDCENYDSGEKIELPIFKNGVIVNRKMLNATVVFRDGVVFHNSNSEMQSTAEFYSPERIGPAPDSRK